MIAKTRTSVYATSCHFVFVTKYRRNIFTTKIKQEHMKRIIEQTASENDITIQTMEVCEDHVHLLTSFPPKYSISDIVKRLKGTSARRWFIEYHETKKKLWRGHLWHRSYFVGTTGTVSTNIISEYIKNQHNQPPVS